MIITNVDRIKKLSVLLAKAVDLQKEIEEVFSEVPINQNINDCCVSLDDFVDEIVLLIEKECG